MFLVTSLHYLLQGESLFLVLDNYLMRNWYQICVDELIVQQLLLFSTVLTQSLTNERAFKSAWIATEVFAFSW